MTTGYYESFCSKGGKDPVRNLELRRKYWKECSVSKDAQQAMMGMCREDLLFYLNAWVTIYEPRDRRVLPFITYPFQDTTLLALRDSMSQKDEVIEKSRDMGASWMCLCVIEHDWHFYPNGAYAMYSYKEDLVDKSGDPDSLFWKIDHIHKNQPSWFVPTIKRNKLHIGNLTLGGTIDGAGITENTTVGGRKTVIFFDEAAKVKEGEIIFQNARDSTRTRWFTSTANGPANKFYEIREQARGQLTRFLAGIDTEPEINLRTLHWILHPEKNKGLYFTKEGKPRSIAYDREYKRCGNPREMAQEWDIDYLASGAQFFSQEKLEDQIRAHCRPPDWVGNFVHDTIQAKFIALEPAQNGFFYLWFDDEFALNRDGAPPENGDYAIGADVSVGTGASNSTLSVTDKKTGRKVAAFAHAFLSEYEFARLAVAMARWFNNAFLLWERQGPGASFGKEVLKLGYRNLFYEIVNEKSVTKKYSDKPGWAPSVESKVTLLNELRTAELEGKFVNQCVLSHEERKHYVLELTGAVNHSATVKTQDVTKARANHGDRVIADALSWRGCKERPWREPEPIKQEFPVGSFGWRMKQRQRRYAEQGVEPEMVGFN